MSSLRRMSSCTGTSFKRFFRNRNLLVWMIIAPVLLASVSGCMIYLLLGEEDTTVTVYVQDNCGNGYSEMLIEKLDEDSDVVMIDPDVDIQQYIEDHPSRYILSIPKDFSKWIAKGLSSNEYSVVLHYDERVYNISVEPNKSVKGEPIVSVPSISSTVDDITEILRGSSDDPYHNYLGSVMVVCSMLIVLSSVVASESFDKSGNILSIERFSRLRDHERCISYMSWIWIPGLISAMVAFLVIYLFHEVELTPIMVLAVILCSICQVPVALILSTLVNVGASSNIVSAIVILPTLMLSGGIITADVMPEIYQEVAAFFPTKYVLDAIRLSDYGLSDVADVILPVLAFTVVFSFVWLVLSKRCRRITDRS